MQSRLEDVSSIHSALALTSTYEGVDLVDEEDDLTFALRDFGDDGLQTLFEFTLILRTSDQGTHIEGVDLLGAEVFGDVTTDDTEGQTFCDSRLTDTRLPR